MANGEYEIDPIEVLDGMNGSKSTFISENDFVINFCLHVNKLYGDEWKFEAEFRQNKTRLDVIIYKMYKNTLVEYFLEFKYQRAKSHYYDHLSRRRISLKACTIKKDEIIKDIKKLRNYDIGYVHRYCFLILATPVMKAYSGLDFTKLDNLVNTNKLNPKKKKNHGLSLVGQCTLDCHTTSTNPKKLFESILNPFSVTVLRVKAPFDPKTI